MTNPRALYLNRGVGSTITSSTEDSGYPDDNAADWRDYLTWQGSGANTYWVKYYNAAGVTADSIALVNHNLNTVGARFKVEGSDNDADWTSIVAYITPSDDLTLARCFTENTYKYHRMTIDNNGGANFIPHVGVFFVGKYLEFPERPGTGFDPDEQVDKSNKTLGGEGHALGVVLDYTLRKQAYFFSNVTQTWVTNTFIPFWNTYRNLSMVVCWDYANFQSAAYLMQIDQNKLTVPYNGKWRELAINFRGRKEE